MRERLCPICSVLLIPQTHLGVTVDVCPTCAGIWFDADELNRLYHMDPLIFPTIEQRYQPVVERYNPPWERLCPACREPLYRYHYLYTSSIELDGCDQCGGVWVDHGELSKMEQVLRDAKVAELPPETRAKVELANAEFEHQERMSKLEFWKGLFTFLRARPRFPI